ncbi:DNA-deoxyinosine glycosylase [Mycolicibacterium sp. CBM1]
MSRSPLLRGLAPIVGAEPRLLILGNMPSAMSLSSGQYYGNPRNVFWRITAEVYGFDSGGSYGERTEALSSNRVAVWDVLRSCRRVGSLDSAVEPDSMVANNFEAFFAAHVSIERVCFNGAAAQQNFTRLVGAFPAWAGIGFVRLPSTSPAHTMSFADKLTAWREGLRLPQAP